MSEPGSLIRSLAGRQTARNFHSYVITEIGEGIVSGKYPIGTVLPNDAEMMAQFDVSRTVLREALKTLESKGLVEARPKVGTKVSSRNRWNHFDPMVLAWFYAAGPDEKMLRQLHDVRFALEPLAARQVALTRTADDLRLINYWIRQMENSTASLLNFAIADYELHVIIADASKNNFMRSLISVVELSHTCAFGQIDKMGGEVPAEFLTAHQELAKALADQNAEAAQKLMTKTIKLDLKYASHHEQK